MQRYLKFDNDRERFGRRFVHWSIPFRRSSRQVSKDCTAITAEDQNGLRNIAAGTGRLRDRRQLGH
jgi:hypothetical protein